MMQLEERLNSYFDRESRALEGLRASPARARARAGQRRRRQVLTATAAVAALAVAGTVVAPDGNDRIEASGDDTSIPATGSTAVADGLPVSTGPVLTWSDAGPASFATSGMVDLAWTGERFVVLGWTEPAAAGSTVLSVHTSTDGVAWEKGAELADAAAEPGLWARNGTVVVWTYPSGQDGPAIKVIVQRSDDHGRTFGAPVTVKVAEEFGSPLVDQPRVTGAVALGDSVYLAVQHAVEPDPVALLERAGRRDLVDRAVRGEAFSYAMLEDAFEVCFGEACEQVRWEDVLAPDQMEVHSDGGPVDLWRIGPDGTVDRVDSWPTIAGSLNVVGEGEDARLALVVQNRDPEAPDPAAPNVLLTLLNSAQPMEWLAVELPPDTWDVRPSPDGSLVAIRSTSGSQVVASTDGGRTWSPLAPGPAGEVWLGPAGTVVAGASPEVPEDEVRYSVARNDHRLDVGPERVTLTDLANGERLFDVDVSGGPYDFLDEREAESDDGQWTLTVLHPDTGEEVMVVTEADLPASGSEVPGSRQLLGWSAAGSDTWGWQPLGEAFGPEAEQVALATGEAVRLVVGVDRVVALVPSGPRSERDVASTKHLFVAELPRG